MIKRKVDKFWFPWWPEKWLWGTIRIECTPAERGIWVDLLSLASKDDGHIRANEETPYPIQQLAGMLILSEKELDAAINKFIKLGKLTKLKSNTLYVTKWEKYQFSERHKRRIKEEMSAKTAMGGKKVALKNSILNNNTLNNNKEEQKTFTPTKAHTNITTEELMDISSLLADVVNIGHTKIDSLLEFLRELSLEFPDLDYVYQMKKKVAWWKDNPLTKKSNIHLQIRNWFIIAQKGFTEAKKQQQVGKDDGEHKEKYPMLFLNCVYAVLREQGKDNDKYSKLIHGLTDHEAEQAYIRYNDSPVEFIKFLEEGK